MLMLKNIVINNIIIIMSLKINNGFKLIWSILLLILIGLKDFLLCRIIKWINVINIVIIDIKKCIEKNRFSKILLINLFPHINIIVLLPIKGIIATKLVITILAQYDIWFKINEYPMNEIIINNKIIIIPEFHIFLFE